MEDASVNRVTFLIKPASSLCNMRCKYCFYEDVASSRSVKSMGIMGLDTARRIVSEAFRAVSPGGMITFLFQGGEPTLAGLAFFQSFMLLEKEYEKPGVYVHHAIQTNGLCIDNAWAAFLRDNHFLVGLSIDGSQAIHDRFRVDAAGKATWERTVASLRLLERHQVETNLLCVVTAQAAKKPQQVYKSLIELGPHPLQFIPCLDPLECNRGSLSHSLTPEAYGKFLCNLFDCWYRDWKRGQYVSIRTFDDYLRHMMRMPPSSCAASGSCGHYLVAEADGSLYPCDFYVLDQWYLGNIRECSIEQALSSANSQTFLREGRCRPEECLHCRYFPLCRGGCKRDWEKNGANYYCSAYRRFFPYAISRLEEMAASYLIRNPKENAAANLHCL